MRDKYISTVISWVCSLYLSVLSGNTLAEPATEKYVQWEMKDYAIAAPLRGLKGDAQRGKQLVIDQHKGNCLACHALPIPEEPFHGTVGPPLTDVGNRLSAAQIRLRIVDEKLLNPQTIMPGYYRDPGKLNQIIGEYQNTTMLTAQEVEDVVAYLSTLK